MFEKIISKQKEFTPFRLFIIFIFLFIGLFSFYVLFYKNTFLKWYFDSYISFTSGDLLYSIKYCKNLEPYSVFNEMAFPYPPFTVFLYHILSCFISIEGVDITNKVFSYDWVFFYTTLTTIKCIAMYFCILKLLPNISIFKTLIVTLFMIFSFPMQYGLERGNVVVTSFILVLLFLMLFNSNNTKLKEISIVLLAISSCIKLYPVFYGLLLISYYNHNWRLAIKAIVLGILLFLLPFIFLKRSFFTEFSSFLQQFSMYSNMQNGLLHNFSLIGITYTLFGDCKWVDWKALYFVLLIVFSLALIVLIVMNNCLYKQLFYIYLLILCFGRVSRYVHIFALLPVLFLIKSESRIKFDSFIIMLSCVSLTLFYQILKFRLIYVLYIILIFVGVYCFLDLIKVFSLILKNRDANKV